MNMKHLSPEQVLVKCPQCGAWPMSLAPQRARLPLGGLPLGARSAKRRPSTPLAWRDFSFLPQEGAAEPCRKIEKPRAKRRLADGAIFG